jgi:hypothetical protein
MKVTVLSTLVSGGHKDGSMKLWLNAVAAGLLMLNFAFVAQPARAAAPAGASVNSIHNEFTFEQDGVWYLYVADMTATYLSVDRTVSIVIFRLDNAVTVYRLPERSVVSMQTGSFRLSLHANANTGAGQPNQMVTSKGTLFYVGETVHRTRSIFNLVNGQVRVNAYWLDGVRVY